MQQIWLKAKNSFSKQPCEKKKRLSYGLVYTVLWILKEGWIVLSETINILRNLGEEIIGAPHNFTMDFMHIAPSSDRSLLTLNLSLNLF